MHNGEHSLIARLDGMYVMQRGIWCCFLYPALCQHFKAKPREEELFNNSLQWVKNRIRFIYNTQFVQFSLQFLFISFFFFCRFCCSHLKAETSVIPYKGEGRGRAVQNPKRRMFCISATKLTNFLSCGHKTDSDTNRSTRKGKNSGK